MIPPLKTLLDRVRTAWGERAVALKAISFALIGVVNSAIDFAVFSFAYYVLALPILVSNSMAWVVAVSGSYVMNSTITFATESGRKLAFDRYIGFALSQFAGFLANTLTVWCMVELAHVPAWGGKLVAIFVSFAVNFSLSHFVVFRARGPRQTAE